MFGAKLVRSETRNGSSMSRNLAARHSLGDKLAFFDADVTLHPDTLSHLAQAFQQFPALDAVFGSYDKQPGAQGLVSGFRNLLHAHVHHRSLRNARTFWTGCGAITRDRFFELQGFDERYNEPSIEDVELGLRLHNAGGRILLDSAIQVTYQKRWTLASMVHTDFFQRAIPWAELIRDHARPRDLNFRTADGVAAVFSSLLLPLVVIALQHPAMWWWVVALDLGVVAALQASTLEFFRQCRGVAFAVFCFPLLLIYNLVCVVGLLAGLVVVERQRDRWFFSGILAALCLILTLQIAGGAYRAEFNGDPDEPAHFVSGLMIYDYVTQLPSGNPWHWAQQYYVHYPKVAIGHWPPGFYFLEAAWWLLFRPSRWSVLILQSALVMTAAIFFYRLLRKLAPPWLAWTAVLLLILSPISQQSFDMAMADALCLLLSVLLAHATVRLLDLPSMGRLLLAVFWLACALLTKGTAAALIPVPFLALLFSGLGKLLPRKWLWGAPVLVLALGLIWYLFETSILRQSLLWWGGVSLSIPWPVGIVPNLVGPGILVLAVVGVFVGRKKPVALVSASMLISSVAISYILRAMNQPRHWIIILPALLLLATECLIWLKSKRLGTVAWLLAAVALLLFPWGLFHQPAGYFNRFISRMHHPARSFVSSNNSSEGALVVALALSEPRPSSVVVRASKTLATSGWNGENYHLTAASHSVVSLRLDELAIDTVLLDSAVNRTDPPHHRLLRETLQSSASWRICESQSTLTAWCRVKAPVVTRKPLRIDLSRQLGISIQEDLKTP
jgi:cellulose synthase/poly-beta-1,6-N-acetylglucosamine synthase-like glycosyltransferase